MTAFGPLIGFFGKLPGYPDFVRQNAGGPLARAMDTWIHEGVAQLNVQGGDNWKEKFDYWALFWGMPVMGITGLILMYPVMATNVLPGWVIPAALVAHGDEALLAFTWIVFVHIFFTHFSPGLFPLNKSIITGKVNMDR